MWLAFADLGVAVPTIAKELDCSVTDLQWANNAFSLVTGGLVLAAGRFGDLFGRRRMLELGVALFALFSIVAALAPGGVTGLVIGRGLMGIGAALILPATLSLIPPQFPASEQPKAFGAWMAVAWAAQGVGPAIGGVLTDAIGWQSLLWINVALGPLLLVLIRRTTPESRDADAEGGIDLIGLGTSAGAAFALLYGLTEGQTRGFGSPLVIGLLVGGVALAVLFVIAERRVKHPLVDLELFRRRAFDGVLIANLTMNFLFGGVSFLLAVYLQDAFGESAVTAGLLLLPATATILLLNPIGARLGARRGARLPVIVGTLIMGVGTLIAGFLTRDEAYLPVGLGLLVLGVGIGLMSTPIGDTAVGGVKESLAGMASGVFKMSSMLGGAFGVAILVTIQQALENDNVAKAGAAAGLTSDQIAKFQDSLTNSQEAQDLLANLSPDQQQQAISGANDALAAGTGHAIQIAAIVAFVAVGALFLVWPRHPKPDQV